MRASRFRSSPVRRDEHVTGFVAEGELKGRFEGSAFTGEVNGINRDCRHTVTLQRR
jgi:hypothetical protein